MKRLGIALAFLALLGIGCAKVRFQAPKEPIKVDISMRLDVYQHVIKDINSIEDSVSGSPSAGGGSSLLQFFVTNVYAQSSLSPEAEQAVARRKDRREKITTYEKQGVIGEDRLGLLEVRNKGSIDSTLENLISSENNDRMIIYKEIAASNMISVEEVQKLYATRLQEDAPSGTPIEVYSESSGSYQWKVK